MSSNMKSRFIGAGNVPMLAGVVNFASGGPEDIESQIYQIVREVTMHDVYTLYGAQISNLYGEGEVVPHLQGHPISGNGCVQCRL